MNSFKKNEVTTHLTLRDLDQYRENSARIVEKVFSYTLEEGYFWKGEKRELERKYKNV